MRLVYLGFAAVVILFAGYVVVTLPLAPTADLVVNNGDEPLTLDPAKATGQLEGRIIFGLLEGLTTLNADGEVIPGVATHWEISPDGRTYTFHLRKEAKWSNGVPLTSSDFYQSWKRLLEPTTGAPYNYQLFYVENAEAYSEGKITDFSKVGISAPDPQTFVVRLTSPVAFFLELTAFTTLSPVYMPVVQEFPHDWTKPEHFIGNGPYLLKVWRVTDYILLEANPNYWRPVPIHRIKLLAISNATTVFNLFYSHKVDLVMDKSSIPPALVSAIRDKPYFHANPFGATSFIRFNVKRKPFDDVRVRKALGMSMDRERIVKKITLAGEVPCETLVPPLAGYEPPKGLTYDPEQARKLLADAGYPDGKGFPNVSLLYAARGNGQQVAEEMQEIWKENLGISVTLRAQEWKVYLDSQQNIDYDFMNSSWVADYSDPKTFLDMFVTDGGNNCTGWSNKTYDSLLDQAGVTHDPAQRLKIMSQMEQILVEQDLPISPLYHPVGMALYDPNRIHGFKPNFVDDHRWTEMSVTK